MTTKGAEAQVSAPVLFTSGYEGLIQAQLLDRLSSAGIDVLVDVRAVPNSRKPGFSKRLLSASCEARDINYVHLQALGTPKPGRQAARAGDAAGMEAIFKDHLRSDAAQEALSAALDIAVSRPACLLCFERDPHMCHRRIVGEAIAARTGQRVVHL